MAPALRFAADCAAGPDYLWQTKRLFQAPAYFETIGPAVYGRVNGRVTLVKAELSDRAVLTMRPVEAYEFRWIALVIPDGLSLAKMTLYTGQSELAHAVPFYWNGEYQFVTWLRPGDPGPVRATSALNRAVLPLARVYVGPWGTCLVDSLSVESCRSVGQQTFGVLGDYAFPVTPRIVIIAYRPAVSYLLLFLASGRTTQVRVVHGAGVAFAAVRITARPRIVRWAVYDSGWNLVSGGQGPPDASEFAG